MESLTLTGVALLVACVVGVVELLKALFARDWRTAVIIAGSAVVGFFVASAPEIGVTQLQGMVIGFAGSGSVNLVNRVGGN